MRLILILTIIIINLFANHEQITLQLPWKHQFQFAGFYIAKEKGFYREAGLHVNIKEYDSSINVVDDVLSQKADFGAGHSSLLIERAHGKPVVLLDAIYQSSPFVLVTNNSNVKKLSDLIGKRVMINTDAVQSASIETMLQSNGVTRDKIEVQPYSFNYRDLIEFKTDAMACYLSNELYFLDKENISYTVFDPKKYGYDFYGDILFTSSDYVRKNHQNVRSFRIASKKGWLWAFENIEETAKIIYKNYNTQKKSLESIIYEGKVLKELSLIEDVPFGHISRKKFEEIAKMYRLSGLLSNENGFGDFFDHIALNKNDVKIGVLAKRGREATYKRWNSLASYLNNHIETYSFQIVPLNFEKLEDAVNNNEIDFVITNTMYYVLLENRYGISRIATLINSAKDKEHLLKEFGGVILTRKDNTKINKIADLKREKFGAVSKLSFGGWIMAYEELLENGVSKDDLDIVFLNTHDAVVNAVLSGEIEAGTVRTDTLERMALEGKIDLSEIKIIAQKRYEHFPYLISTKLYPEWPIAKLPKTSDSLANKVLSELVKYKSNLNIDKMYEIDGWTVPLDYSSVHKLLIKLKLPPYDKKVLSLSDVFEQYAVYISIFLVSLVLLSMWLVYTWRINNYLDNYNKLLDKEVKSKTQKLTSANKKLKEIAQTDFLTGISNRGYFVKLAKKYFDIARRNDERLQVLSLDIDFFKNVNDQYGHKSGDDILVAFTKTILSYLRKSDLFGRVGGEEFCIILQNTTEDGALLYAERIRQAIAEMKVKSGDDTITITVSIGIASLENEDSIEALIIKSDKALYEAKNSGRNQVKVYKKI